MHTLKQLSLRGTQDPRFMLTNGAVKRDERWQEVDAFFRKLGPSAVEGKQIALIQQTNSGAMRPLMVATVKSLELGPEGIILLGREAPYNKVPFADVLEMALLDTPKTLECLVDDITHNATQLGICLRLS